MAPKKRVVAQRSQTARKHARAQLGALRSHVVAQATLKRYERAVQSFFTFLDNTGRALPHQPEEVDDLVCEKLEEMWQEGEAKAYAGDIMSGLTHFIESLRGKLPAAWRLFTAWGKAELPMRALPLSVEAILAMCGYALDDGNIRIAASFGLAFHCFLRTGELNSICKRDVHLDAARGKGVINLGLTKGGQRRGVIEHVALDDRHVVQLLALSLASLDPGELVCGKSKLEFSKAFKHYLGKVGMLNQGYKLYSFRRGGATYWFKRSGSMTSTCERGRWSSEKTARIYINEGLLVLLDLKVSPSQRVCLDEGISKWRESLSISN